MTRKPRGKNFSGPGFRAESVDQFVYLNAISDGRRVTDFSLREAETFREWLDRWIRYKRERNNQNRGSK